MKILLIHADATPWATQWRAIELKKRWTEDEVDIVRCDQLSDSHPYDIIHVLYSGGLGPIKGYIINNKRKIWLTLASQRTLDLVYDNISVLMEVYRSCRGVVAQNPVLAHRLIGLIGEPYASLVHYIPNGVNEELFNRLFIVGYVGNDQSANPEHKGYHLVKQACDELGLEIMSIRNSHGPDFIPNEDMPKFYSKISCLVIPSMSEGCNNPTLEALAMNIPVISTRVGIAEHLEGVTLVERNVDSIKGALRKLSGRIQILENYTWDIIARKYRELYVEK
jgi:glycosyltransferase involved in cell wall biosynthesis